MSKALFQLIRDNAGQAKRPVNVVHNDAGASLYIYDVIDADWGVSAQGVIGALAQVSDAANLDVYINSPGGDVFEGRAIMAALSRFPGKKVAHIDSLCASAATSIALACNEVRMTDGAFFMIHNASGLAWGDKNAMRETADLLEKIEGSIVNDYTAKTGKPADEIVQLMNDETWYSASEAFANGFIDTIEPAPASMATAKNLAWNLSAYAKAPQALAASKNAAEQADQQDPAGDDDDESQALNADEIDYLKNMTALHEKAVALSKAVMPLTESDDVEDFAESIIEKQSGQIALMQTWIDLSAQALAEPAEPDEPAATNADTAIVTNSMSQSNKNRLALLIAS